MINKKYMADIGMMLVLLAAFGALLLWYGIRTEVVFKVQGGNIYRQVKNGLVGAHCRDQDGVRVIAPSRFFGPEWVKIASLEDLPEGGKTFSTTCFPYDVVGSKPISSRISLTR